MIELYGKTLGVIGFGRIGRQVGEIGAAFGMKVSAYDVKKGPAPDYKHFSWETIDTIFHNADVISLNCLLTPENHGFINKTLLSKMKPTAFLINASRGQLINEADLSDALEKGILAGAALDVVSSEPIGEDNPLLKAKNCLITPHIAWATLEARKRIMDTAAENIRAFLKGGKLNVVN